MSDSTYIGRQVKEFTAAPEFEPISKVVLVVSDDTEYFAGNDTGRTLTMTCPWATQAIANNALKVQSFQYQPYTAVGARIDPAAELGDAVTVGTVYSGIYEEKATFGQSYVATISAPSDEEIDHEYPYVSKQDRKITRQVNQVKSELKVQAGEISAKVSKEGGNTSFGWVLDEKSWTIKSNGKNVLYVNDEGMTVRGKIYATGGKIGCLEIYSDHLSYNGLTWGGKQSQGFYTGPYGIKLGQNFKVDMNGRLEAANGKFSGTITATDGEFSGTVKAGKIQYGGSNGTFPGSGITSGTVTGGYGGTISGGTITTANVNGGVNASLGYANYSHDVFLGNERADAISTNQLSAYEILLSGKKLGMSTISYVDSDGKSHALNVVTWRVRG